LKDFDTVDELYCSQVGEQPVEPFLVAKSKITGKEEPLAYTYMVGKGRIFQLLLGHGVDSIRTPSVTEVLRRSVAWCGNREVLPLPLAPPVTAARGNSGTPLPQGGRGAGGEGPLKLVDGRFGKALDPRGAVVMAAKPADFEPPMTVECWAKLDGKAGYNLLVANHQKESRRHWEVFSDAGTGRFCAYLPGYTPSRIDSPVDIVDGKWHFLAMQFHANRALLYIDGKLVKDEPLMKNAVTAETQPGTEGQLQFGGYAAGGMGCDGLIDEVRISNYARAISSVPTAPLVLDRDTLGLWRFDSIDGGAIKDESARANGATAGTAAVVNVNGPALLKKGGELPKFDKATSTEWANVGNDKGGMRYSALKQINKGNVKGLKVAWTYNTRDHDPNGGTTLECTPIMIEGILYITTVKMHVVALDAATGKELWRFDPKSGGVNRGVAYWTDGVKKRIIVAFQNGFMFSLDAKTGELDPAFGEGGVLNLKVGLEPDAARFGYGCSSAPGICKDYIILGFLSSEVGPGAPGDIRAFDVRTGKEAWRFHTVPRPGEFGYDTWPANAWRDRGGANNWSGVTIDEKNGIVFCGTGSAASDFFGGDRLGNNLFANCTLALDANTGKRLWHFQTLHHDLWDHDLPCPPVLCTVKQGGKLVEAVAQPTKTGWLFVFDRRTGKPIHEVKEVPVAASDIPGEVASPTQPQPVKPPPFSKQTFTLDDVTNISPDAKTYVSDKLKGYRYGTAYEPPSIKGSVITPGFHGGATWSGASFDPTSGLLFVNSNNTPYICTLQQDATLGYNFTGYNYFRDKEGYSAIKPPWGNLTAIDVSKGTIAWQVVLGEFPELTAKGIPQTGTENFGGTIVTAGGLVFIGGTMDEKFRAFDSKTGKTAWEFKLPAGGYATPSTYMLNGKQYVVIACGGGGKLRTPAGDAYVAFALP
jgi:quinoprotein glucose dehydrogenase